MNKLKFFYNAFWEKDRGDFESYARNSQLPNFFSKGEVVLDVGCGDGTVGEFLQRHKEVRVIGIDISEEAIKKARKRGIEAKIFSSENKFPFEDNSFDAVFWGDNIEHLFNPTVCGKEIRRVLKKGGKLILSCPNMGYWRYRIFYFLKGALPDTEWTGVPPWEWSHIRFFNLSILERFVKTCGFVEIRKVIGVSERRIDKALLPLSASLFGMVFLIEVV